VQHVISTSTLSAICWAALEIRSVHVRVDMFLHCVCISFKCAVRTAHTLQVVGVLMFYYFRSSYTHITHTYTNTHTRTHTNTQAHTHKHASTYTHAHTHTQAHTHTHTHTCMLQNKSSFITAPLQPALKTNRIGQEKLSMYRKQPVSKGFLPNSVYWRDQNYCNSRVGQNRIYTPYMTV